MEEVQQMQMGLTRQCRPQAVHGHAMFSRWMLSDHRPDTIRRLVTIRQGHIANIRSNTVVRVHVAGAEVQMQRRSLPRVVRRRVDIDDVWPKLRFYQLKHLLYMCAVLTAI